MKAVILAGGLGSRLGDETLLRPKPMIEIGGRPILWHIMKLYAHHGVQDFVICLGYRGYVVKEYFANYVLHGSDVTFNLQDNRVTVHQNAAEPWNVTLVDTGDTTQTGGRLGRVAPHLSDTFCLTYGDGLSNVDITGLLAFHRGHGGAATLTAVRPQSRFGVIDLEHGTQRVRAFREKPVDDTWVSGGFFVLEPSVLTLIEGDDTAWEREPLEHLAASGQLSAYKHAGFWQPMDTPRDKTQLETLWASGMAPWKVW